MPDEPRGICPTAPASRPDSAVWHRAAGEQAAGAAWDVEGNITHL